MKANRCSLACMGLLLCALSGRVDAATDPLSRVNRLPASLELVVRQVTGDLTGNGYEVKRGYWALWGSDQCKYTVRVLGRCFGPNPTAPYAVPFVPPWRDEYVDDTLHNVFGPERRGYSPIFRLHETEALVILAEMPPPGAYLGLQTSVFTRQAEVNRNDAIFLGVSAELRELLFAAAPNPSRHARLGHHRRQQQPRRHREPNRATLGKQPAAVLHRDAGPGYRARRGSGAHGSGRRRGSRSSWRR